MSEPKSTATSGRIFPEVIILPIILVAGPLVVLSLARVVDHPLLTTVLSYLGSCLLAFLPILGVFVAVVLAKGGEEPNLSRLMYMILYVVPAILGAGVYYFIHNMLVVPSLVFLSEVLGGLVVFFGGWMLLTGFLERRAAR